MKNGVSLKVSKCLLDEMKQEKQETGISLYRLIEKAWEQYKKSKEVSNVSTGEAEIEHKASC